MMNVELNLDGNVIKHEEYEAYTKDWACEDKAMDALRSISATVYEDKNAIILTDVRTGKETSIPITPEKPCAIEGDRLNDIGCTVISNFLTFENRHLFKDITINEKEEVLVPLIERMCGYAVVARSEGLLALEDLVNQEEDPFIKMAVMLIVDANDPCKVRDILEKHIIVSKYEGIDLLSRLLVIEAVLRIASGSNPRLIREALEFFCGDDIFDIFRCQSCKGCDAVKIVKYGFRVPENFYCPRRDGHMGVTNKKEFLEKIANRTKEKILELNKEEV